MQVKRIPQEKRRNRPEQWLRPRDIKIWTESEPKKMLNHYLAKNALREWTEEFTDKDTGEIVKVDRQEVVMEARTFLDNNKISDLNFYLQTGDVKAVELSDSPIVPIEETTTSRFRPVAVTFLAQGHAKFTYVCYATSITEAIQICKDFGNVYRNITEFAPYKAQFISAIPIEDDDQCIPEAEQVTNPIYEHQYYKVGARLTTYDFDKEENIDYDFIIASEDIGQAKARVAAYCKRAWHTALSTDSHNTYTVRKAVPFTCDCLVPGSYSLLYKGETK